MRYLKIMEVLDKCDVTIVYEGGLMEFGASWVAGSDGGVSRVDCKALYKEDVSRIYCTG